MPIKISFPECSVTPDYSHLIFKRIEPEWPFLHYIVLRLFEGAGLIAGHRDSHPWEEKRYTHVVVVVVALS